jgi:urease accessory protein
MLLRPIAAPAIFLALTSAALAHTGHGHASGFTHGFMHPIGGLDHVLAMVAVGLYGAMIGGRALWLVPATFIVVIAAGGALGAAGYVLPYAEIGIAASVVVLGLAVAFRLSVPALAAMALVGFFAVFHGHAHGAEMPEDAAGYTYAAGFMLATAMLHCAGIAVGVLIAKLSDTRGRRATQVVGSAMALAGVAILVGAL